MSISLLKQIRSNARLLRTVAPAAQVSSLKRIADAITQELQSPLVKNKKLLSVLHNESISLADGIVSNDVDVKDITNYIRLASQSVEKALEDEAKAEEEKEKAKPASVPSDLENMKEKAALTIAKYAKYAIAIPKRLPGEFTAKRAPVIPLSTPQLDMTKLKKAGIAEDSVSYYPILKNQAVLGMDPDWIKDNFKGNTKAAVDHVLALIEKQRHVKFTQVGGSVRRNYVLWVWIVNDRDLTILHKCSPTGHFKLTQWGFAFPSQEKDEKTKVTV